jgi:hypothetical protein
VSAQPVVLVDACLSLTVIAFFDGLASASPDRRLLPSLTVVEEMVKAELAFGGVVRVVERTVDGSDG